MHNIKKMLMEELKKFDRMEKIPTTSIDLIHKLTDTIKNIDKIEMLESEGYSEATDFMGEGRMYGTSYARGRYAKRDRMGRYSRDAEEYSEGASSKERMMETFDEMLQTASGKEREIIHRCMKELDRV